MTTSTTFLEQVIKNNGTKSEIVDAAVEHLAELKKCPNKISCLKRHIRSAAETFISNFIGLFGTALLFETELLLENPEILNKALIVSALLSAVNTAIRASAKATREKMQGNLT